jgi:hypothetical protein
VGLIRLIAFSPLFRPILSSNHAARIKVANPVVEMDGERFL